MTVSDLLQRLLAFVLVFLLSPLILAIALAVRLRLGGPVLFFQQRPGLHGRGALVLVGLEKEADRGQ